MSDPGYEILSIDDLDRLPTAAGTQILRPLRRRLGFQPFGLNVWVGENAGDHVIEPHREQDGTEELYVVLRGTARFTLGDESIDAPVGTFVHATPGTFREATASEPETTVLAMGAEAGRAFTPSAWEDFYVAYAQLRAGDAEHGRASMRAALEREPGRVAGRLQRGMLRGAGRRRRRRHRPPPPRRRAQPGRDQEVRPGRQRPRLDSRRPALHGADRMSIAHVDELDAIQMPDGFVWRPVRRRFGIRAFGVNAYTANAPGGMIVEEHTENSLGHEEIYLVLRGRARFTVDGNDHEL